MGPMRREYDALLLAVGAEQPRDLTRAARYFLERFDVPKTSGLRVTVDRDPVALL